MSFSISRIFLFKAHFFIVVATLCLISCQNPPSKESQEDDAVSKATKMIDQGNYDGAIGLLEKFLSQNQSESQGDNQVSDRAYTTLASAYAGRAGVRVENFWDLLIGFDAFDPQKKPLEFAALIPEERFTRLDSQEKDLLRKINFSWKEIKSLAIKAEKVPLVELSKRGDLLRARDLLSKTSTRGSKLYRALLTVTFLKSDLQQADLWHQSWQRKSYRLCEAEASNLGIWIYRSLKLVQEGLGDFSIAYPDNRANYLKIQSDIQSGLEFIDGFTQNQVGDVLCGLQSR